ncbi:hypothetical protein GmHk_02G005311 [Glycine max]|nr:hypothetical protein GmHk_02G005311 [Glycine max]
MESILNQVYEPVNGSWRMLWNIQIPTKVKFFLWRMRSREVDCPYGCILCNMGLENNWHIAQLWHLIDPFMNECELLSELWFKLLHRMDKEQQKNAIINSLDAPIICAKKILNDWIHANVNPVLTNYDDSSPQQHV